MAADPDLAGNGSLDLLPLALSRPKDALKRARAVLAADPPPLDASIAHQAIGIVLREFGDIEAAIRELRVARRLARQAARRSGSAEREVDVLATLGVALVFAGRTASGRQALNTAARRSTGQLHGRVLLRRGGALLVLGHHRAALADLNGAIGALRLADDPMWEARALTERAFSYLALGSVRRAAADLRRAEHLFRLVGQELESADATVHRGVLALRIGDLPAALTCFDQAAERFDQLGTPDPNLSIQRCAALLAAGLPQDALPEADEAIARVERTRGQPTKRAELLLTGARCALAAGRPAEALDRAAEAGRLFDRQHRRWWRAHAQLARVLAGFNAGPPTGALLRDARRCVQELAALSSPESPLAHLYAGRIALGLGRTDLADRYLATAARSRRHGPALTRAVAWLAEALRAEAAGNPRRLTRACRLGLAVIDEHRGSLGSSELRAQSTAHGAELAALGQRQALRLGRPRLLLAWSERWRASALAVPPVRPPDDEELRADLAAMRDVTSRLERALADGLPTAALHREQSRLERAVRARALRTGASRGSAGGSGMAEFAVAELLQELGDDRLLELVEVDGDLHVLVCGGGRVRRFAAGRIDEAAREVEYARFELTRLAYGLSAAAPATVLDRLVSVGAALDRLLLGEAARHLQRDTEVIIVPPGRLHAVPWALLPSLRHRTVSIAPSATSWLRVRRATAMAGGSAGGSADGPVVLVRGPELASQGAEVPRLAADYAESAKLTVLGGGTATTAGVLDAIDGARLAHIAAHGTFRADSPLFSALRLDDGPLTVYDLERLRRAPHQIVLSSCDSGLVAPAGADELLGLASSLIPLGTAGIVASVVPVNDRAVVPLMTALHRELRGGAGLARALRDARRAAASDLVSADPVAAATGWSFICLGAA
jgi:tetratricopeptide (TPR) repeat protein